MKNFCLIGASGYIAERHMKAILETKNNLNLAYDINDSVGIIDSYFPESEFFTDYKNFQEYLKKCQKNTSSKINYFSIYL